MPIRRKALRPANEEENHIVDVVKNYAIHNPGIGFSLQKVYTIFSYLINTNPHCTGQKTHHSRNKSKQSHGQNSADIRHKYFLSFKVYKVF